MPKQALLDFGEGFLTVMTAGGVANTAITGSVFPGWWVVVTGVLPVLALATLAGLRKVQARRNGA